MTGTQLILPGSPPDETAVVEQFIDASREIVPSVQVALAKRIVRPGSNRVLCLAARTSVPWNDDERASVSDLALRLSDGTNVVLSLSFFNDDDPVPYASSGTYGSVAPQASGYSAACHYPAASAPETSLGMVFVATALIAAAGFYAMVTGPFSKLTDWKPVLKPVSAHSLLTPHKTIALHHPAGLPPVAADAKRAAKAMPTTPPGKVHEKAGAPARARLSAPHMRAWRFSEPKAGRMFVPPPPPTFVPPPPPTAYSPPYSLPASAFDRLRPPNPPAPAASRPSVASKSAAVRPAPKSDLATARADKHNKSVNLSSALKSDAPPEKKPAASQTTASAAAVQPIVIPFEPAPAPAYTEPLRGTAPLPGNATSAPRLERITPPADQDTP